MLILMEIRLFKDFPGYCTRYCPYYYRSIRTPDGKVRNIYLGTEPSGKENGNGRMGRIRDALAGLRRL
ncbi:MAG: hypothetical protein MUP55_01900 [Candidatus Aenigmarchaeota archaeon]|nr:hypothetical protein [Candidatus Aenigmarchaeota archaeon]